MIIFLNLKGQIVEGYNTFAFYDTVSESVLSFARKQVFDSKEDFEECHGNCFSDRVHHLRRLIRFTSLIPEDYFND